LFADISAPAERQDEDQTRFPLVFERTYGFLQHGKRVI